MNIPARYCTGYLPDIGVSANDAPMDFSGWFEACLGGRWHTFNARFNVPGIGRILIARGRDAGDVAISMTFGPNALRGFKVRADEVTGRAQANGEASVAHGGLGRVPVLARSAGWAGVSARRSRGTPHQAGQERR